jgi:hypothetical protein
MKKVLLIAALLYGQIAIADTRIGTTIPAVYNIDEVSKVINKPLIWLGYTWRF